MPFVPRCGRWAAPDAFIAALRLTFQLIWQQVIAEIKSLGIDLDVVWLPLPPCTTAEMPWKDRRLVRRSCQAPLITIEYAFEWAASELIKRSIWFCCCARILIGAAETGSRRR